MPPWPCTTKAFRAPSSARASAIDGREGRRVDAEDAVAGAGRVCERPEDVEDGADSDLLAHRGDETHRRVVGTGEHEAKAELVDRERDPVRRLLEADPERLENVGRACRRAGGTVPVLRDRRACCSGDERRRGGDVERVGAVAARADDVDDRETLRRDGDDVLTHRLGEACDLVRGLALGSQRDEEAGDLRVRPFAVHDRAHQLPGILSREVVAVEEQLNRGADDHPRKFLAIAGPSGVRTLSGWNWTPSIGSS